MSIQTKPLAQKMRAYLTVTFVVRFIAMQMILLLTKNVIKLMLLSYAVIVHASILTGIDMKSTFVFILEKLHLNVPFAIKVLEIAAKRKYTLEDTTVLWLTSAICVQEVLKEKRV
jgi:hypothetical protein